MESFLWGRRVVYLAVVGAGLLLLLRDAVVNALWYTQVAATVERTEEVCVPKGQPVSAAVPCEQAVDGVDGEGFYRRLGVHVTYTSPADGEEHTALVVPIGGEAAVQVHELQPGDPWRVWASDSEPGVVKVD